MMSCHPQSRHLREEVVVGMADMTDKELVLDREAATELVRLLIPVVGRTEIGRMVDSS